MADEPVLAVDLAALQQIGDQLQSGEIGRESHALRRRPVDADPLLAFDCYGSLAAFTETNLVWNAELHLIHSVLSDLGRKIGRAAYLIGEGDVQVTRTVDGLKISDDSPLDQLLALQQDLVNDYGTWGAAPLRANTADALAVAGPGGNDAKLEAHSRHYRDVAREVDTNLSDLQKLLVRIPDVATGFTGARMSDLLRSTGRMMEGAMNAALDISGALLTLAGEVDTAHRRDARGVELLTEAHAIAKELTTAWGAIFDPFSYDGEQMIRAHHLAMDGIAERVAAHTQMKEGSLRIQEFFTQLNAKARGAPIYRVDSEHFETPDFFARIKASEMLALVKMTAGDPAGTKILSAEDLRTFEDHRSRTDEDHQMELQAFKDGQSAEHRAYLLRAVALGYDGPRLRELNQLIGEHGADPAWMREHLTFLR